MIRPSSLKHISTLLLSGALSMLLLTPAIAQDEERKTKQTVAMSQSVFEKLQEIQEFVELKDYASGHAAITELLSKDKLSPYEKAQIHNLSGYSYYLQEQFPNAIRSYERVLAEPDLPEALQQSTLKTMAQLHFIVEDYPKALETVKRLMAVVMEPAADVYMLLGQAHFQMANYTEALTPIKTAVDMYSAQGRTPLENWLLLLRVCYYELTDFPNMIGVLEQLIAFYPKDTYVLTLAGVHSELGDTKKQMALVESLYENGQLSNPSHIVNLANLYLLHEIPYKSAALLEKEMDSGRVGQDVRNLRLLSQAWYSAREDLKAVPPLRRAAELSGEGELYVRLAQAYINLENWPEAATAIEKGIELGGLSRADTANIMLGMSYFNQQKFEQARRAFQRALPDNRSKRTAEQWVKYVDSEIRRLEIMNQTLPVNEAR
ncbi:MAG: tetratricopeptide (TPR) repeat protein, partial [Lysobacterales bacterium]